MYGNSNRVNTNNLVTIWMMLNWPATVIPKIVMGNIYK